MRALVAEMLNTLVPDPGALIWIGANVALIPAGAPATLNEFKIDNNHDGVEDVTFQDIEGGALTTVSVNTAVRT